MFLSWPLSLKDKIRFLRRENLFSLIQGGLTGLSAPGFNIAMLAWVGLIPALIQLRLKKSSQAVFMDGFLWGAGYHLVYMLWYWGLHPLEWMGFTTIESVFTAFLAWCVVSFYAAFFVGIIFLLYSLLQHKIPMILRLLMFPLIWVVVFRLFQQTDFGVPWAFLQYTQAGNPWIRSLTSHLEGGGIMIDFIMVFHQVLWAEVFFWVFSRFSQADGFRLAKIKELAWGPLKFNLSYRVLFNLCGLLPLMLPLLLMVPMADSSEHREFPSQFPSVILQGNLPIEVVRSTTLSREAAIENYFQKIDALLMKPGTLLVLPEEGAIPMTISVDNPLANPYIKALYELANRKEIFIVSGAIAREKNMNANSLYNSLILIRPVGNLPEGSPLKTPFSFYHKRRLVPFGEYTPLVTPQLLSQLLHPLNIDYSTPFQSGEKGEILKSPTIQAIWSASLGESHAAFLPNSRLNPKFNSRSNPKVSEFWTLGPLICFEAIYPELARGYEEQHADLLVNISNLGWFHGNHLLEAQFLAMCQMRAAETGIPMIVSTNTGVSAFISSSGEILRQSSSQSPAILFSQDL
ncbi:MAG: hypothetical protein K2X66_13870 [Cyanobacteria bacterium]|nr:hypothetical protein [Cyanobacteriota bacterium]